MPPDYWDADWLERKYHDEGLTQREIAEACGVSPTTIRKRMKRYGIETREVKGENHGMYGRERSGEVKRKISEKLTGREFSEKSRRRMSEAHRGKSIPDEVREKIAESLKGVPKSDETRRRMSRAKSDEGDGGNGIHWMHAAYNRGFKSARRKVHDRDEVCQVCQHDGSDRTLEVHHILPVRLFREVNELDFEDAHCIGNLVLLCEACHPMVEGGLVDIELNLESIPEEHHEAFERLWVAYQQ